MNSEGDETSVSKLKRMIEEVKEEMQKQANETKRI
jgi:hypothetical protein